VSAGIFATVTDRRYNIQHIERPAPKAFGVLISRMGLSRVQRARTWAGSVGKLAAMMGMRASAGIKMCQYQELPPFTNASNQHWQKRNAAKNNLPADGSLNGHSSSVSV
jgi:hypothetical protein